MNRLHESMTLRAGYFEATRSEDALELLGKNVCAFALAYIIAFRANWRGGYNRHGCAFGEAFLGDFKHYGMSERQYRTAKSHLTNAGFATFRTTNRGTIGRLADTRLFKVNPARGTGQQQATDGQTPTTLNLRAPSQITDKVCPATKTSKLSAGQKELADRCEAALGAQWINDAGKWLGRIKSEIGKSGRVVAEVENAMKELRIRTTPAQYAEQIWKEFC